MRRLARMYLELNMVEEAEGQVAMAMEADRTSAEVWALQVIANFDERPCRCAGVLSSRTCDTTRFS